MSQLTSNLSYINAIKSDIKSAIEAKGVDMTGYSFPDYPAAISQISAGGNLGYIYIDQNGFYDAAQSGVDGYAWVEVSVPQSVSGYTEKDVTEAMYRNWTSLSNDASFVAESAFYNCTNLQTVYLPSCSFVYSSAFKYCTSLQTVEMSSCRSIYSYAFDGDTQLVQVSFPLCTNVGYYAFGQCDILSDVFLPECNRLGSYAFIRCSSLSVIDLPNCSYIDGSVFYGCLSLSSISLPNCLYVGAEAFGGCDVLSSIDLPMCFNLESLVFDGCDGLISVSLGYTPELKSYTFNSCSLLMSVHGSYVIRNIGNPFTGCSNLRDVWLPIFSVGTERLNLSKASYLKWVSIGNELYFVPSYPSFHQDFIDNVNSASIFVDKAMYDQWIVADGWSSLSGMFYSYGDATAPMLSVDYGVLYGKTAAIFRNWSSYVSTTEITSVNLPNCRYLGVDALYGSQVTSISLPECKYIGERAIACNYLTSLTLPVCEIIQPGGNGPFYRCERLQTLTIGTSKVCILTSTRLGLYSDQLSIYVPFSLVESYKWAPNWSVYSTKIFSIPT